MSKTEASAPIVPVSPADSGVSRQASSQVGVQAAAGDVVVALYLAGNSGEFQRRAQEYAKRYRAVTATKQGKLSHNRCGSFQSLAELISTIQGVHKALRAAARSSGIQTLALFTHGLEDGIHTGNNKVKFELRKPGISKFVDAIKDALAQDVRVLLYACSTGKDKKLYDAARSSPEWNIPPEGQRAGASSFAALLARELRTQGKSGANVFAHSTPAHTTENYCARVFGSLAGETNSGIHLFEVLYPATFLSAELSNRVTDLASKSERTQKSLRKALRESAWEHYVDCISKELRRNNLLDNFEQEQQKRKEAGRPLSVKPKLAFPTRHTHIGMEAFHDPKQTAAKLHAHFRTHWMANRKLSK